MRTRTSTAFQHHPTATLTLQALGITLAASFVATRLTASPFENLSLALLVVLAAASVLCAWACAAIVAVCVYVAVSLDDVRELAAAAVHASSPAMWLPSAIVLLSTLTPETTIVALFLIANTARLLVSRAAPQTFVQTRRKRRSTSRARLFRYAVGGNFIRETLPAMAGALALQAAAVSVWAGYPLAAAAMVAVGAGTWTSSAVHRGAYRPVCKANLSRTAVGAVFAFVIASSMSFGQVGRSQLSPFEAFATESRSAWRRLLYGPQPASAAVSTAVNKLAMPEHTIVVPAKDLVPGVILRPDTKPLHHAIAIRAAAPASHAIESPMVVPFTGEYHLFPTSSGQVQEDSVVYRGTPLDAVYRNVGGGAIETSAYQPFQTPVDFTQCEKVQITLRHNEATPALASLELVRAGGVEELGSEVFGLGGVSEETLEFVVPASSRLSRVTAIRVGFRCDPGRRSESTKVAVLRFTLIPRTF